VSVIGLRLLVAGILLRAAVGKARAPSGVIAFISEVLGAKATGRSAQIAGLLVVGELFAGIAILAGVQVGLISALVAAMMIGFAVVLFVLRVRGSKIDCGCFGGDGAEGRSGTSAIVRNVTIAAGAGAIASQAVMGPASCASRPVWALAVDELAVGALLAVTAWLFWVLIAGVVSLQVAPKANHDR